MQNINRAAQLLSWRIEDFRRQRDRNRNQRKALETQRKVTDTTNEMLARNAELLKIGSAEARREVERGIFDIETIKQVHASLIETIQESIQIAAEGKRSRLEAQAEMQRLEGDLKQALLNAGDGSTALLTRD